jgi:hypothetical protein
MPELIMFCVHYPKWFGTAFKELAGYDAVHKTLRQVLLAENWQEREKHYPRSYRQYRSIQR